MKKTKKTAIEWDNAQFHSIIVQRSDLAMGSAHLYPTSQRRAVTQDDSSNRTKKVSEGNICSTGQTSYAGKQTIIPSRHGTCTSIA